MKASRSIRPTTPRDSPRYSTPIDRRPSCSLEGVIDLSSDSAIPAIVANVHTDIVEARNQGVTSFFLSTLTPVLNFSRGCFLTNADVKGANDALRALAVQDNVPLVDAWAAFQGHESTYIGGDGLHPSVAGQEALARTFFDVIRATLEPPSTTTCRCRRDGRHTFRARRYRFVRNLRGNRSGFASASSNAPGTPR